jgi:MFS superfamily sulfate permease-like transporter
MDKRGPWNLGRRSNLINKIALGWIAFVCVLMTMPPNVRTGVSMGIVIAVLFLLHHITGPHQMRKPVWAVTENSPEDDPEC